MEMVKHYPNDIIFGITIFKMLLFLGKCNHVFLLFHLRHHLNFKNCNALIHSSKELKYLVKIHKDSTRSFAKDCLHIGKHTIFQMCQMNLYFSVHGLWGCNSFCSMSNSCFKSITFLPLSSGINNNLLS